MRLKVVLYFLTSALFVAPVFAQTDSIQPEFKISSFSFGLGALANQSPAITQNDYKKIAPTNSFVNADLSGFNAGNGNLNTNGYFNINIGIKRLDKKTNSYAIHKEYRIGMRYYSEDLLSINYTYNNPVFYDSLKRTTMLYNVTVDSSKAYSYHISNSTFMFDIGAIYESNYKFRLSGYAGYNIGLGTTFRSDLSAINSSNVTTRIAKDYESDYNSSISKTEVTHLRNSFVLNSTIIWGANYKLSKTKRIGKKCMLNLEGRFGVNSQNIQNYGTFTRMVIGMHFGFKFLL